VSYTFSAVAAVAPAATARVHRQKLHVTSAVRNAQARLCVFHARRKVRTVRPTRPRVQLSWRNNASAPLPGGSGARGGTLARLRDALSDQTDTAAAADRPTGSVPFLTWG
jgi:hypothetical protein